MAPVGATRSPKKSVSKQARAGITFPVTRVNRTMKARSGMGRIGGSAPVYMTAVVEYIAAEVLDLAGQQTSANKRKRVTPEDVMLAIRSDAALSKLFSHVSVYSGDKIESTSALKPTQSTAAVEVA